MGWDALAAATHRQCVRTFRQDSGAVYRRTGYADVFIKDIVFDDTYFAVDANTGVEVSSKSPIMGVNTADLPTPRDADKDTILMSRHGKDYVFKITNVQPDGEAGTTLFLTQSNRTR